MAAHHSNRTARPVTATKLQGSKNPIRMGNLARSVSGFRRDAGYNHPPFSVVCRRLQGKYTIALQEFS